MLSCPWWLYAGLMCTTCYPCVMYTSKSETILSITLLITSLHETPLYKLLYNLSSQCTPIITRS
jgi:hypothetical protein